MFLTAYGVCPGGQVGIVAHSRMAIGTDLLVALRMKVLILKALRFKRSISAVSIYWFFRRKDLKDRNFSYLTGSGKIAEQRSIGRCKHRFEIASPERASYPSNGR